MHPNDDIPRKIGNYRPKRSKARMRKREMYLTKVRKELWPEGQIPNVPVESVAELATELFTSTCGARRLAGLHLPEAVRESCRGNISPCSLVLALLYLERLKTANDQQTREYLAEVTPSELFIVSMMVANKFIQDEGETSEVENWYWSDLSGFDCKQLNQLEREFLNAIRWEVFVKDQDFWSALMRLHRTVSLRQGLRRGWFTYEETAALLDIVPLTQLLQQALQIVVACLASYAAATMACMVLVPLLASVPTYQLLLPLHLAVDQKIDPVGIMAPSGVDRLAQEARLLAWSLQQLSLCVNISTFGQRPFGQPLVTLNQTGQLAAWVTS
ncbi:protein CNPPD1 [Neocloeon triangulifer]|uniref:protein CNPPD1 n=1 Tax=Neocloeon triangulifer TaxID=2078957 RepID=UPI00286F4A63|nr:protein CNPPD1 [Neocloeon triangulifer]